MIKKTKNILIYSLVGLAILLVLVYKFLPAKVIINVAGNDNKVSEILCAVPVQVAGQSMEPILQAGSRPIFSKCFEKNDIKKGTVVMFKEGSTSRIAIVNDVKDGDILGLYQPGRMDRPVNDISVDSVSAIYITNNQADISNFEDCVAAGNPVMESYPRQCRANGQTFVEDVVLLEEPLIGGDTDKGGCLVGAGYSWCEIKQKCLRVWEEPCEEGVQTSLLKLFSPVAEQEIASPLVIEGEAVGSWFFEADFPVILTDWDGRIIAQGIATAQGDWMTEDFVPFKATLEFEPDTTVSNRGSLILKKDNPSGLPQYDDAYEITVFFK